jgi:IS5 family transposase
MQALPGTPYDGHTLARIIPAIETLLGNTIERLHTDADYRGHNAPPDHKFKIYTAKQKRRATSQIKQEMKRRSAIEPVIGHLKKRAPHGTQLSRRPPWRLQQRHPRRRGYNFRRLTKWLRLSFIPVTSIPCRGCRPPICL